MARCDVRVAAHEVALRERFQGMPDADLRTRREELADAAYAEARVANPRGRLEDRIEELRDARVQLKAEHRTETVLHPEGSEALSMIKVNERILDRQLARNEADLPRCPKSGTPPAASWRSPRARWLNADRWRPLPPVSTHLPT